MGQKLNLFYSKADELGGLRAKIRLSLLTKIPSTQADALPDSEENLKKFEESMVILTKEFSGSINDTHIMLDKIKPGESLIDMEKRLRNHISAFMDLMSQRSLFLGNIQ